MLYTHVRQHRHPTAYSILLSMIPSFTTIFRTTGHPADAQSPWTDHHGKMQGLVGGDGVVCRIVDFPPVPENVRDLTAATLLGHVLIRFALGSRPPESYASNR